MSKAATNDFRLGVIGTGAMGSALVRGIVQQGVLSPQQVAVYDCDAQKALTLQSDLGVVVATDAAALAAGADAVLLAVKPQVLADVVAPLTFADNTLVISIAAGVSLEQLTKMLAADQPVVRVMPNILAEVGAGAAAYCGNSFAGPDDLAFVATLLEAVGVAVEVDEKLMDAVTGLAGSGPAFAAVFLEALTDGAVAAGLSRQQATVLAAQVLAGVGCWVLKTGKSPAELKNFVTSPGGTTIAGLRALEAGGLRSAALEAVVAAAERSREMGA